MKLSIDPLQIDVTTIGCEIPSDERVRWQPWLEALADVVRDLPNPALGIHVVWHLHSAVYNAELTLRLPGRTLFVRDRDAYLDTALERGLTRLRRKAESYKEHPDHQAVADENRRAELESIGVPDTTDHGQLAQAVDAGDYREFRNRLAPYEDWINSRAGRLVQRNAEAEAQLGHAFFLGDIVEEVFLTAFERFLQRPSNVPLSKWLESLIEPSIHGLLRKPDEEVAEARFAQTLRETDVPHESS